MSEQDQDKDQKTEEATPKRRQEAREKGQVAMSSEFVAAMMLLGGLGGLLLGGGAIVSRVAVLITDSLRGLGPRGTVELSLPDASALMSSTLSSGLGVLAVFILPLLAVGTLAGYAQVGFLITPKAIAPDLSKLNPIKGFSRIFSTRSWMRTLMAVLKIAAIATTMVLIALGQIENVVNMGPVELGPLMVGLGHVAMRCTAGALIVVLLLSLIDLAFQRFQQSKDLRMSVQEVKEEHKNTEGDPHVKGRIRRVQREMAMRRMMADVPRATVVVTNPTHYAVALLYERDERGEPLRGAPVCLAKGAGAVAQRIKAIAREHEVVCYEDVPLARGLYAEVEVGAEIPEEFFNAVAAVLAYVYRLGGVAA